MQATKIMYIYNSMCIYIPVVGRMDVSMNVYKS